MKFEEIEKVLSTVMHPAYDKSVMELSLVQNLKFEPAAGGGANDGTIKFRLVFHRPDPLSGSLKEACVKALTNAFPGVKVDILELIDQKKATENKGLDGMGKEEIKDVDKVIAIASGKGGVGKSTIAVNLAVALAKQGYSVGLIDADVYGPSIPKMTGTEGQQPALIKVKTPECSEDPANEHYMETKDLMVPIEKFGVKWISIGYFASPEQALIWRGPMASSALKQLIYQVDWGKLDYLLIDLPPGTGDIHISMVQEVKLTGAIIVTTPQNVATADVEKGINMFQNKGVNTKVLGIVENMSWFTPAELPNNKYYIFGKGGGAKMAEKYNIPLLAQIPIVQGIMESGDAGQPSALGEGIIAQVFEELAEKI